MYVVDPQADTLALYIDITKLPQHSAYNMSSSEEESDQEVEDEEFNRAFGGHHRISNDFRDAIVSIKDNSGAIDELDIGIYESFPIVGLRQDTSRLTSLAWRLFGRYIANNTHLKTIDLHNCNINNQKMTLFFSELVRSNSLKLLILSNNSFGIEGLRVMVPFLRNAAKLECLDVDDNNNMDTECFELLVSTFSGTDVEELSFGNCNITDISALERFNVSRLTVLHVDGNNIGRQGFNIVSNLLQQEGSVLKAIGLSNAGVGDDETEMLVNSLKHNTSLEHLYLDKNNIGKRGCIALLKLVNDISSIESTYNSNRTLKKLVSNEFDNDGRVRSAPSDFQVSEQMKRELENALYVNDRRMWDVNTPAEVRNNNYDLLEAENPEDVGRTKVIKYQLNSQRRKELCQLQGIEYSSIFVDIEPNLLPKILVLIGQRHGQSELYTALLSLGPELTSFVDTKAIIKDKISYYSKELARLNSWLALKELGDSKHLGGAEKGSGNNRIAEEGTNKRQRTDE